MPIRRIDNRSRFRGKYLNDIIKQVQVMNRARFHFSGQGGTGGLHIAGNVSFEPVYETGDFDLYPDGIPAGNGYSYYRPLFRAAIPTWGTSYSGARAAAEYAEGKRFEHRRGFWNGSESTWENAGYAGWNFGSVQAEDYLTSGGYAYDGIESFGYKTGDHWGPWDSYEDLPPDMAAYWGVWTPEEEPPWIIALGLTAGGTAYLDKWGDKANDGGSARIWPYAPDVGGGGNYISSYCGDFDGCGASLNIDSQAVGFPFLLQSLPPGAVITSAKLPVKISGFNASSTVTNTSVVFVDGAIHVDQGGTGTWVEGKVPDITTDVVTSPAEGVDLQMVLMGRRKTGLYESLGRTKRATTWDALASFPTPSAGIGNSKWVVFDITGICQSFLDSHKKNEYFQFALFPALAGSLFNGNSLKGYLAGLVEKMPFVIEPNPIWGDFAPDTDLGDYKAFGGYNSLTLDGVASALVTLHSDYMYMPTSYSRNVSWSGLQFGEGVVEWQLPASENKHAVTYRNIVRGDSPIIV